MAIAASLAFQAAAPAPAAQNPPPSAQNSGPEIVVQGTRDVERRISDFVRALTDTPMEGQISRFDWAVCPMVQGLSERQDEEAAERMRSVAGAAGMQVGKPGCNPNVLIVVTDDSRKLVERMRNSQPRFFDGVSPKEMGALDRGGPAAAWHIEGRIDQDGREVPRDERTGQYILSATDVPSHISTTTHPHFAAAIVILDSRALAGLTVVQLADYAAMRAFARIDPSRVEKLPAPTILTLLDTRVGSRAPITLTAWDLAYLKSLYGSNENRLAGQQRQEMKRKMANELSGSPDRQ